MKETEPTNSTFGLRLRGEELERYNEILRRAFQRQPRARNTDVNRRLLELDEDTDGLVTAKDIAYFRGRPVSDFGTTDSPSRAEQENPQERRMLVRRRLGGERRTQNDKQTPAKRKIHK